MITITQELLAISMRNAEASHPAPLGPLRDALWVRIPTLDWLPNPDLDRAHGRSRQDDGDRALLDAFVHGSAEAFDVLVERHGGALLAFGQRSVPTAEAQDAVQDAFLALFRRARSILDEPDQNVRAFLFGATRLGILDVLRNDARTGHALDAYARLSSEPEPSGPLELILDHENRTRVLEAMESACTPLEQDVMLLALEGRTNTEIARALDLPAGHIGVLKHRARHKIERALDERGVRTT